MPSSNLAVWPEILALVGQARPHRSILDVGPGRGKAAPLLREYVAGIERIDAIEAWAPYVTEQMEAAYDEVMIGDVMLLSAEMLGTYDVVLLGDVIEHLAHEDGEELLERIRGAVVIATPRDYFQNPEAEAIWTEEHRSLWRVEEFLAMPRCEIAYVNDVGAVLARLRPAG